MEQSKIIAIIGKPVRHSLSPIIHKAGYKKLGLNYRYIAVEPTNLRQTISDFRDLGFSGFNVTMPFKEKIIKMLDRVDASAKKIGAVNTVVNRNGKFVGYNTDGIGAVNALKKVVHLKRKKVLLVGSGGAAKAIAFALKKNGVILAIASRKIGHAKKLARKVKAKAIEIKKIDSLDGFDVLINATPIGMEPNTRETPIKGSFLRKGLVVFDIVYKPLETKLLKEARKKECKTINGTEMLLEQAFEGFKLFTGKKAPEKEMRRALTRVLM